MTAPRKVALVTGSATGAGRAIALRFAAQGLAVAINYSRSEAEASETLAGARAHGVPAILCKANVADDKAVRAMVAQVRDELGGLDVLVNNAGTTHFIEHTNFEAVTEQVWDDIFSVNVRGAFQCIRAAAPLLKERNGSVGNVTSVAGLQGHGSSIPYAASKAALNAMTKSLARALAPEVRVNAVAPGPINTRWLKGREEMVRQALKMTPLGRAAEPDDVADAVVFLALGQTLMTGQIIVVDGGRTM
ncbi:MAG TPA: SDR family oxidoreductase [Gemmataceae bacterium]|nr:SDR family oxidoreductase [Gemmataceae bacterium]